MEKEIINLDALIEDLGCGTFQVILIVIISLSGFPTFWAYFFMTFGLYNPGWKCLDNTTISTNVTDMNFTESVYITDSCDGFDKCHHAVFNPEASTIVTEFGLICERSWIASLCISLFMIGNVSAYIFVGIAGDKIGRKLTIQASMFLQLILSLVSMYSTSWQMFAATEFMLGAAGSFSTLIMVVANEFVPHVWRLRVCSLPTWTVGIVIFAVLAMIFHDWKVLRLITSVCCGVSFLALCWIPKTPRFLSATGKRKQFLKLLRKIVKYNKTEMPQECYVDSIVKDNSKSRKTPSPVISLIRKGYKIKAVVIGLFFLVMDMSYFALTFGASALPGNIYVNMLILTITELPANFFAAVVGNIAGRRMTVLGFSILGSICIFCVAVFDLVTSGDVRTISTLTSLVVGKIGINTAWYVQATAILEMYPTIVRSTLNSYARMMSMVGGVLAPYLVPSSPSTFYISYLVMGGLLFFVGCLVLILPETKGKILRNDWEEAETDVKCIQLEHDNGRNSVV